MSKHVCDCGAVYSDLAGIEACQRGNHGNQVVENNARQDLINIIKEYDSNTFCAADVEITDEEAAKVADLLIEEWTEGFLDGISIMECFERVRDTNYDDKELSKSVERFIHENDG